MERIHVSEFDFVENTHRLMRDGGLLLVTAGNDGKPNAMTIGWGQLGTMWRKPFFTVAVRLSRYTYKLMEESDSFTVCLPAKGMKKILEVCGTKSGRDIDKIKELYLSIEKGYFIEAPYIGECPVHYECKIAYKTELKSGQLIDELENDAYPRGDYHVLYFGQILGVYALVNALTMLPK
jgi:flavin reductase (DIM6/NTAB) family NADH-FMN oxidoreductase RutF